MVVNQPGASGSVGTKGVLEGAKDGYTWAAGAAVDIGGYKVLGLLDSQLKDWNLFFAVANVNTVVGEPERAVQGFRPVPGGAEEGRQERAGRDRRALVCRPQHDGDDPEGRAGSGVPPRHL